jgi:hypothetical protein
VCVSILMLWVVSINEQKCKELGQIKKVRGLLTTIVHFLFARDKVDCCILVKNLLDADSLPEDTKDFGTKSSKDRLLVCSYCPNVINSCRFLC